MAKKDKGIDLGKLFKKTAAETAGGANEEVIISGTCIGNSLTTFEELVSGAFVAMLTGNNSGKKIDDIAKAATEKDKGVAGLLNSQKSILSDIKNSIEKIAKKIENIKTESSGELMKMINSSGLPVVIVGGEISSKDEKGAKAKAQLEIIMNDASRESFNALIEDISALADDDSLPKFELALERVGEAFKRIDSSMENLETLGNVFDGVDALNKLDTEKLDDFILFIEDLSSLFTESQRFPEVSEQIVSGFEKLNKLTDNIEDIIDTTRGMTQSFFFLRLADKFMPDFDENAIINLNAALFGEGKESAAILPIFSKIAQSKTDYEKLNQKLDNMVLCVENISHVAFLSSNYFGRFNKKKIDKVSEWFNYFILNDDAPLKQLIKEEKTIKKSSEVLDKLSSVIEDLAKISKNSKNIKGFNTKGLDKVNEYLKYFYDEDNDECIFNTLDNIPALDNIKKTMDNFKDIVKDIVIIGALSILLVPLAPLLLVAGIAVLLVGKLQETIVSMFSPKETANGIKNAQVNLKDFGLMLLMCGAVMLIGGLIFTAYPDLFKASFLFGVALGAFLLLIIGSISLASRLIKKEGGIKALASITQFIVACSLIMLLGGTIMTLWPKLVLGSFLFALSLGLFLVIICGAIALGGLMMKKQMKNLNDIGTFIALTSIILLFGGLIMTLWPKLVLGSFLFAIALSIFLLLIVGAVALGSKLGGKKTLQMTKELQSLIVTLSIILVLGGILAVHFPEILLGSLIFGLILGGFIYLVMKAISSNVKDIRKAQKEIWALFAIIVASSIILLIAGGMIAENPWVAAGAAAFVVILTGLFFGIGFAAQFLSKNQKNIWTGVGVMGAIVGIVLMATLIVHSLKEATEGADLGKMVLAATMITIIVALFGGMAIGLGAIISSGIGGAAIAGGVAAMAAIVGIVCLAAHAVGLIADNLKKWDDVAKIKFGPVLSNLALYLSMLGLMVPIGGLSVVVAAFMGPILIAGGALLLVKKALNELSSLQNVKTSTMKSYVQAFADMISSLIPIGANPITNRAIRRASSAVSYMSRALSKIARAVEDYAQLKVPVYEGTKVVSYRGLSKSDFKGAAENVSLIVTTLGDAMVNLYNKRPDMFRPGIFTSKTPFFYVCDSTKELGKVISKIAQGVKEYAELKVPIYEGKEVVGYRPLTDSDFKSAATNVSLIISTLFDAMMTVYNNDPKMFEGTLFSSSNTPINRVISSTKQLGKIISSLSAGVQAWALLNRPIEWDKEGKPIAFEQLPKGFEIKAGKNVASIIDTLFTALLDIYYKDPKVFEGSLFDSSNTPVNRVIRSASDLGKIVSSLAQGIQAWADLKMAVEWNAEGQPIKFEKLKEGFELEAAANVASIIETLFTSLTDVYNKNPDMFETGWFESADESPIGMVVNSAKHLGTIVCGLADGIQKMAAMTFVSEYDPKTGKPVKVQKISGDDIVKAGVNTGSIITSLFNALTNVYNSNPDLFSDDDDSVIFTVINSVKNMSGAISGIASTIKSIATTQVPIAWDKDGKPIKFETLSQKHFVLAGAAISTIISVLGNSIINLASDPKTAQFFETNEDDKTSLFSKVVNSIKDIGKVIGNISDGLKKYAELKFPSYDKNGKVTGYTQMSRDDFAKVGENISSVLSAISGAVFDMYNANPDWFSEDNPIFNTVLETVANAGESISKIAEGVSAFAMLSIPTKWKNGKPIEFRPMDAEEFALAATNIKLIVKTLGNAVSEIYTESPELFQSFDPEKPSGQSVFERVASSCSSLGEMITNIASGIEYFGNIYEKKLPGGGKIDDKVIAAAGANIAAICVTIGRAIATVYNMDKSLFELPPIKTVSESSGFFGIGAKKTVSYSPNPSDPPFLKVVKSCGAMGQLIADIAMGINEFANIYNKTLPDGSKLDPAAAGKNIADIILCIGHAVASVYHKDPDMFNSTPVGGWFSRRTGGDGKSPFEKVTQGIISIINGLGGLTNIIGYFASGDFPMTYDKDGNVTSTIHIDFKTDGKKIFENISSLLLILFTSTRAAAAFVPKFISMDVFDRVKKFGQGLSESMGILSEMVVSYASLKIPTGFDKKGNITGYKQLDTSDFQKAADSMNIMIKGIANVINIATINFSSGGWFGKRNDPKKVEQSLANILTIVKSLNKYIVDIIKEINKFPDPTKIDFTNFAGCVNKIGDLASILKPLVLGKTEKKTKKVLWMNVTLTSIVESDLMKFDFKKMLKFIQAIASLTGIVRRISKEAEKLNTIMKEMPNLYDANEYLISTYLCKADTIAYMLNNYSVWSIKERRVKGLFKTLVSINEHLMYVAKRSIVFVNAFKKIADTTKLDFAILTGYFDSVSEVMRIIRKFSISTFLLPDTKSLMKDINGVTKICADAVINSNVLVASMDKIQDTSNLDLDNLENYFDTLKDINLSVFFVAKRFKIFKTKIDLQEEIAKTVKIVVSAAQYSPILINSVNSISAGDINIDLIDNYFDKIIEINRIINKNMLKLGISGKFSKKLDNSQMKYVLNELADVYRFGKILGSEDVSGNYDNIIDAINKISGTIDRDLDENNIEKFRKQNKELQKFVKSINSINVKSTDKLTKLLEGFNKLGLNVKDMNKLVDAITKRLAVELAKLSDELNEVGNIIAKESDRKEKRKKIIEKSVNQVKELVSQELTVVVKQDENGGGGGFGGGGSAISLEEGDRGGEKPNRNRPGGNPIPPSTETYINNGA